MSKEQDRKFIRNFLGVLGALAAAGVVFGLLGNLLAGIYSQPEQGAQQLAVHRAERHLQPIGQVQTVTQAAPGSVVAAATGDKSEARSGQQVVEQVCAACHTTKFMNAPQIGNKEEWAPRAKKGLDTLVQHDLHGFGNMPPNSGSVSKAEARAAIKYMVEEKTGIKLE